MKTQDEILAALAAKKISVEEASKLIDALNAAGIELITEGAVSSTGGRGVRLKADFDPGAVSGSSGVEGE